MGGLYYKTKDYDTALAYYFKALEEAKKLNDDSETYPLGNISDIYVVIGEFENAIKYLNSSINFSKELPTPEKEYSLIYEIIY